MKILLTGATGYIGQRLLPVLLEEGHEVICCVRDKDRFNKKRFPSGNLQIIEIDFLDVKTLDQIPEISMRLISLFIQWPRYMMILKILKE
jgi:uncharacterized protein YbjT (DUF2867 family)